MPEKKAPAAAGKTSPSFIHVTKSRERNFFLKKGTCGSWEDLTKPNTCHKISGTAFAATEKLPAAAGKTSTGLIHVIKFQERHFCQKKGACSSQEDPSKPEACHKILGIQF